MAKFKCPRCATIIEANDPTTLQCPNCGFPKATIPAPAPMAPPPASQGYGQPSGYQPPPSMAPPGQPYMGAPQGPVGMPGQKKASGQSIAALVLGICGMCLWWIPLVGGFIALISAVLAVIFGILGLKAANRNPDTVGGKGLAIAGLVLGIVALAIVVLALLVFAAFFKEIMDAASQGA